MNQLAKQAVKAVPGLFGVFFIFWWVAIQLGNFDSQKDYFTDAYWIIPILGGALGLFLSKNWGGLKSMMGKTFAFYSFALFSEGLGLLIYSLYFRISGKELAYPSVGDFIFLVGVLSFSLGAWWALRVTTPTRKQLIKPWWHFLVALVALSVVFYFVWHGFLYEGINDDRGGLTVAFNVLYPTTQLIYLALCLLSILKVRKASGGRFFKPAFTLLLGMFLLYTADYLFLRQSYEETWVAAGTSDILYIVSYTVIIQSLVYFDSVREKLMGGSK